MGTVAIMPFFYSGLMAIVSELTDPFSGDVNDFPVNEYESQMEADGKSYITAGHMLPSWLQAKKIRSKYRVTLC